MNTKILVCVGVLCGVSTTSFGEALNQPQVSYRIKNFVLDREFTTESQTNKKQDVGEDNKNQVTETRTVETERKSASSRHFGIDNTLQIEGEARLAPGVAWGTMTGRDTLLSTQSYSAQREITLSELSKKEVIAQYQTKISSDATTSEAFKTFRPQLRFDVELINQSETNTVEFKGDTDVLIKVEMPAEISRSAGSSCTFTIRPKPFLVAPRKSHVFSATALVTSLDFYKTLSAYQDVLNTALIGSIADGSNGIKLEHCAGIQNNREAYVSIIVEVQDPELSGLFSPYKFKDCHADGTPATLREAMKELSAYLSKRGVQGDFFTFNDAANLTAVNGRKFGVVENNAITFVKIGKDVKFKLSHSDLNKAIRDMRDIRFLRIGLNEYEYWSRLAEGPRKNLIEILTNENGDCRDQSLCLAYKLRTKGGSKDIGDNEVRFLIEAAKEPLNSEEAKTELVRLYLVGVNAVKWVDVSKYFDKAIETLGVKSLPLSYFVGLIRRNDFSESNTACSVLQKIESRGVSFEVFHRNPKSAAGEPKNNTTMLMEAIASKRKGVIDWVLSDPSRYQECNVEVPREMGEPSFGRSEPKWDRSFQFPSNAPSQGIESSNLVAKIWYFGGLNAFDGSDGSETWALRLAVQNDDVDTFSRLRNLKVDEELCGRTVLGLAAEYNATNILCKELGRRPSDRPDVNGGDVYRYTPLMYAAKEGHCHLCKYLVSQGAEIETTKSSVLQKLSDARDRLLREYKKMQKGFGETKNEQLNPIKLAYDAKHQDVLNYLAAECMFKSGSEGVKLEQDTLDILAKIKMDFGKSIGEDFFDGRYYNKFSGWFGIGNPKPDNTPFWSRSDIKFFLSSGLNVDKRSTAGWTMLKAVLETANDYVAMTNLVYSGADVNTATKENGFTPLMWAVKKRDINCVNFLLGHNANIDLRYKASGKSAIYIAIERSRLEIARTLMRRKPNVLYEVKGKDNKVKVNLYGLIAETVKDKKFLDECFSVLDAFNEGPGGYTPLMLAAKVGNVEAINVILDRLPNGLDKLEYINKRVDEKTAYDMAADENIKKLLTAVSCQKLP